MSSEYQDNITSKTIKQTDAMLDAIIKLNDEGVSFTSLLHGNHGIGKTSLIEQLAKRHNAEYRVLNLASIDTSDLLGQLDGKGSYHKPDWLVQTDKRVIYFLDEINRAPKYILQGIFNFLNEKRIHNFSAKKKDIIIAAANPADTYEVTCFEDPAFLSRFAHIKLAPSQKEFSSFLGGSGKVKNTIIQQTLKKSVHLYKNTDFSLGFEVTPDNRKLHKLGLMFDILSDSEIESVGVDLIESIVGFDAASVILETWRDSKKNQFDPKELLRMPSKEEYKFESDDVDIINNINVKLISYFKNKLTVTEEKGFVRYVNYIPKDLRVDFLKEVVKINPDLINLLDTTATMELLNLEV